MPVTMDRVKEKAGPRAPNQPLKRSFNLPQEDIDDLSRLAENRSVTATQVFRQALATELFVQGLVDEGMRLLTRKGRRGPLEEIVFPHMQRKRFGA